MNSLPIEFAPSIDEDRAVAASLGWDVHQSIIADATGSILNGAQQLKAIQAIPDLEFQVVDHPGHAGLYTVITRKKRAEPEPITALPLTDDDWALITLSLENQRKQILGVAAEAMAWGAAQPEMSPVLDHAERYAELLKTIKGMRR